MMSKIKKLTKKMTLLAMATISLVLSSCDEHKEFPDTAMKVGHVVCTDGSILTLTDAKSNKKEPIAVVFHINQDENIQGQGYAVYLNELSPVMFADSLGISQGTSASLTAYDGNKNTFAL